MHKTKLAIIALSAILVLSTLTLVLIPAIYHPTYIIKAGKFSQTPTSYVQFEDPDSYVLEAISNPDGAVVHSLDVTMIDELISQQVLENNTRNFQINNDYYQFMIVCVDSFPPRYLSIMHLASQIILPFSIIALITITIIVLIRNKK
ncbi:MAG: hypothetical protein ACQCN3_13100 [Candidatus Bathyarchaeia archaeon]|jgi:hypothetical protein